MSFAKALVRTFPLPRPSQLDDPELGTLLAERCRGRTDYLVEGIKAAAETAVRSKVEMIDFGMLRESSGWPVFTDPPYSKLAA